MKKIALSVLSVVCAVCMMFGFMTMANVSNIASADTTVELSATAIKKSVNKDKMLLVTAVKNFETVYEVGYNGIAEEDELTAETDRYYTSINGGTKTWTAETIFGSDFAEAGLIVWEIDYDKTQDYTFTAYAKYGTITQEGIEPVGTVDGTERTVKATVDADVIDVLDDEDLWVSNGGYGYVSAFDVVKGDIKITASSGYKEENGVYYSGFALEKSAIEDLIEIGVESISFDVIIQNTEQCLDIYVSKDPSATPWISGYATIIDNEYYFESGSRATIDLAKLLDALNNTQGDKLLKFVLTKGLAWAPHGYGYITLANISVEREIVENPVQPEPPVVSTIDADVLAVIGDISAYPGHGYGQASSVTVVNNTIVVEAGHDGAATAWGGFAWSKASIIQMVALGVKTISFDIAIADANQVIDIYVSKDNSGISYISGYYTVDAGSEYYFKSGANVTVDLVKLLGAISKSIHTDKMLKFVLCDANAALWTSAGQGVVTLSNITVTKETVANPVFAVLSAEGYSLVSGGYGVISSVTAGADSIEIECATTNGWGGFCIDRYAMEALVRLGVKTLSFDIATDAGQCVDIYVSSDPTTLGSWASDYEANDGKEYFYSSGATVTIDVAKLTEAVQKTPGDELVKFVLTNGLAWSAIGGGTVTISNIVASYN